MEFSCLRSKSWAYEICTQSRRLLNTFDPDSTIWDSILFARARNTRAPKEKRPAWLYRSYPSDQITVSDIAEPVQPCAHSGG